MPGGGRVERKIPVKKHSPRLSEASVAIVPGGGRDGSCQRRPSQVQGGVGRSFLQVGFMMVGC